jgi:hypothetical protein
MRLTLTSTLAAAALAFPQLAPSYARAQPAPAPSAASVDAIHDGKAEVNGVLYHYLLAKGRRRSRCLAAWVGFDLVHVAICDAAARRTRLHGSRA